MGKLAQSKVVQLSIAGVSTTLVGIPALVVTGIIVILGLYVIDKLVTKPTINISIG